MGNVPAEPKVSSHHTAVNGNREIHEAGNPGSHELRPKLEIAYPYGTNDFLLPQ